MSTIELLDILKFLFNGEASLNEIAREYQFIHRLEKLSSEQKREMLELLSNFAGVERHGMKFVLLINPAGTDVKAFVQNGYVRQLLQKNDLKTVYEILSVNRTLRTKFTRFLYDCGINPKDYVSKELIEG